MDLFYTIRDNPRARRINITVRRDGTVWVTKPRRVSMRHVERFIHQCEQWIIRTQEKFSKQQKTSEIESSDTQYKRYKRRAIHLARQRLAHFNAAYGLRFSAISIRNQKSRWGSCTRKGVLSFNYRIIFLPSELSDYIIVHELCHLQEMNHSKRFWRLVERAIPDYAACRKILHKLERTLLVSEA